VGDLWQGSDRHLQIFGKDLIDIFFALKDAVVQIWTDIGPTIMPFIKAVLRLANLIGILLIPVVKLITSLLAKFLGPVLKFVISLIANFIKFVTGVINIVVGLLTLNWRVAWEGMKQIVQATLGAAWASIKFVFEAIWAAVKWVVEAIVGFFKWLWDVLVGHSIIPDIVDGILYFFGLLIALPKWIWDYVLKPIFSFFKWFWDKALAPIIGFIVRGVWAYIKTWIAIAKWVWDNVLSPVWNKFKSLWTNYLQPFVRALWEGIKREWAGLKTMGKWVWDNVLHPVVSLFEGLWNKLSTPLQTAARNIGDIFSGIGKAIIGGINLGIDAINGLIRGLNWIGSHVPGLHFHISQIDHVGVKKAAAFTGSNREMKLARGGIPPTSVGAGFRTSGARAIVGEGRRAYPEYVIPTDPRYRNNAMRLLYGAMSDVARNGRGSAARANVGRYGDAFAIGGVPDWHDVLDKGGDAAAKALGTIRKGAVIAAFAGPLKIADAAIGKMPNGMHARDLMNAKKNQIYNWAKGVDAKGMASGGVLGGTLPRLHGANKLTVLSRGTGGTPTVLQANGGSSHEYHFHGDLSFPNIKSGADAEEFVRNLESLVG
jgi:hypothetical protein